MAKLKLKKTKIFLIGGGMGTGKSTFALKVADKYKIKNIICTDIIRSLLKFTLKGPLLTKHSFQLSDVDFKRQSLIVSVYAEKLAREFRQLGKDSIIEGINIWPSYFTRKGYKVVIVDVKDEEQHKRFIISRKSDTYKNFPTNVYLKNLKNIRRIKSLIVTDAMGCNSEIIDEDSNFKLR